jgi:metal-responsive CopG/Arc/MetJ family transcriptional regulator
MKTAISIPDEVFLAAEKTAKKLGISRSELYATAVREYVEHYRKDDVTAKLDLVYADDSLSDLDPALRAMQKLSLEKGDWE